MRPLLASALVLSLAAGAARADDPAAPVYEMPAGLAVPAIDSRLDCVGHNDNFMVAQFGDVDAVVPFGLAHPATQRGDQGSDFIVGEHFGETGFFHVEDFPF